MNIWDYRQPTEIRFGVGVRSALPDLVRRFGSSPLLVTGRHVRALPTTAEILDSLRPGTPVFDDVEPNPTVGCVDALAETLRATHADVVIALGGGSPLDCAKAACSLACQEGRARDYHSGRRVFDSRHLPLIAIPTTAGTGSEVTPISVLDDPDKGIKAPLVHDNLYPNVALVDPELTLTQPPSVTAASGFDALCHAIEGYWSRNHQPMCDLMALEAVRRFFRHFPAVLDDGNDIEAREGMSLVALLGGLAFQLPKNAAVHACSYPLSTIYHLPHGIACAMTLDHFVRFNAQVMGPRGVLLAKAAGVNDMEELADLIGELKKRAGLPTRLTEIGVTEGELPVLVRGSFHPVIRNNPREVTPGSLRSMYLGML